MIEYLPWDSEFFGFSIGKIKLVSNTPNIPDLFERAEFRKYRLIYLFVEPALIPIENFLRNKGIYLIDEKIIYSKNVPESTPAIKFNDLLTIDHISQESQDLIDLAIMAGQFSRFSCDEKFESGKFEELYTHWIVKSVKGDMADFVLGWKGQNDKIQGFVTCKIAKGEGNIGLIAVNPEIRGTGLGAKLIHSVVDELNHRQIKILNVTTQKKNKRACVFYERNGFRLVKQINIYHCWNEDTV